MAKFTLSVRVGAAGCISFIKRHASLKDTEMSSKNKLHTHTLRYL